MNEIKGVGMIVAGEGEEDLVLWTKSLAREQQEIIDKQEELARKEDWLEEEEERLLELKHLLKEKEHSLKEKEHLLHLKEMQLNHGCCDNCECKKIKAYFDKF